MFRFMRDGEPEDPMFMMDPLAIHQQHVNRVLSGGFGYSPFLSIGNGTVPGTRQVSRRMQPGTVSPFGMLGMAGGFMDMFGMMNDMIGNMIRETRRTVRDSNSGLEQMSIGHHIRDRAHIMQRSRNHRTGDQEERQDYINLDENDAAAFDDEWRRETSRFRTQRGLDYRRHDGNTGRRIEGGRLAIQGPEDSPSRQSRRYDW
ncbi:myeloid leukemia factor 2 isoform X4 [Thamnophis elegans]|nr:myeloid leukemia factor 2 isoform X4 [Thamnophis elegans]